MNVSAMLTWGSAILMTMLAGCAPAPVAETVVLDALGRPMCELAGAVVDDGGVRSRAAARRVIAIYDAGVLDRGENRC